MDGPVNNSLPIPRLRLSRQSQPVSYDYKPGPSRVQQAPPLNLDQHLGVADTSDADSDQLSTPRVLSTNSLQTLGSAVNPSADTPAARLRAVLARYPSESSNHAPPLPPPSSSEPESDYYPMTLGDNTPSMARDSLKDIFNRALRDPGDTPQKGKHRRNSIDLSEVDASPGHERDQLRNKVNRLSLSDEEAEYSSSTSPVQNVL